MPFCPNPECPHFKRTGRPAEFLEGASRCSDCGSEIAGQEFPVNTTKLEGIVMICIACGQEIEDGSEFCYHCGANAIAIENEQATPVMNKQRASSKIHSEGSRIIQNLTSRYTDAYLVARATCSIGSTIKIIGIIIAIIIAVAGLASDSHDMMFLGVMASVITGALFYVIGVLVSAQGQILKATLDAAVNSSPFLSKQHIQEMMSL